MLQWQKKITKVQQTATSTAWHQYFNNGKGEKNNSKNRSDNWPNLETLKMGRVDFFKTWNKNVFCQNRKVEPKGGGRGLQVFQMLEAQQEFWLWSKEKMNKKWFYHMRGTKIFFKNGLQKKKKFFHLLLFPLSRTCPCAKFLKNWATQKCCHSKTKMTVGTGSWRPAVENAIPCVEIEQR